MHADREITKAKIRARSSLSHSLLITHRTVHKVWRALEEEISTANRNNFVCQYLNINVKKFHATRNIVIYSPCR